MLRSGNTKLRKVEAMADPRESFATLEDSSTGAGEALISRVEGEAAAAQAGSIGFSFKDISGNVVLPSLDVNGNIRIATDDRLCLKSPAGELAAGSASIVAVTGASITLAVDTDYDNVGFIFSSRRDSLFQLIQTNDATVTVIAEFIVGAGQYTVVGELHCFKITTGSTGIQTLSVKAKNFEGLSSLRATITAQIA